ncbi:ISL3 family transposase [Streptomyces europaeiscabiei]|uniref:ISL3 family transposase n=1 Tax=Streptomyces europaeiscabiei TaxID=146819 RepID=UPI0029AFEBD4|nr:ISL3 family transposase [Streptomyces europaeiscabiei]MDX3635823.1 ISL3 family transposase [Streptomyces europaeiscabiei]MDX3653257.1 ISL3 family transposase [Streptomyces europaeiscabiei]
MGDLFVLKDVLFPNSVGMVLDRLTEVGGVVVAEAHSAVPELRCPDCATASHRVHSRYGRRLAEYPVGGRRVVVKLEVRRFFCDAPDCGPRTFVEQVEGLTTRYARAGPGVKTLWRSVALTAGGRPGTRLCRSLAVPTGRARLLGQLHAPDDPAHSPRVLGVDDFAFRRSRTYGTILLDVETSTPIDLLADRTSETLAAWLTAHPGAEIVCRDRDSGYSRAIKAAAPDATEVADRWHLLQNLSAAIERTCHQHRACLHKYALDDVDAPPSATAPPTALLPLAPPLDSIPATPLMQRVTERHAEIHRLREATWTISAIARRFGLDRKTVRRYLTTDLDVLIASARDRRPRQLDPYRPYIQQRFTDGCTNAAQLYREIHEHGYRGNHQAVRLYIRSMRGGTAAAEPPRPIPTPRKITSWIMRPRDGLSREEQDRLDEVRIACPDIATACDLARVFTGLVRDRRGHLLTTWVREAETTGPGPVRGFAGFLRQDWDAVLAGMTLDYSSGVVEGHVNRLRRSSGRCTAEAPSGSFAPVSCCDRDRHEIPTRPLKIPTLALRPS